jgi:hypothetical protein
VVSSAPITLPNPNCELSLCHPVLRGPSPPLLCNAELDGYLGIERRRQACGDPQHIFNKLLFDATNEALLAHYNQVGGWLQVWAGR